MRECNEHLHRCYLPSPGYQCLLGPLAQPLHFAFSADRQTALLLLLLLLLVMMLLLMLLLMLWLMGRHRCVNNYGKSTLRHHLATH